MSSDLPAIEIEAPQASVQLYRQELTVAQWQQLPHRIRAARHLAGAGHGGNIPEHELTAIGDGNQPLVIDAVDPLDWGANGQRHVSQRALVSVPHRQFP